MGLEENGVKGWDYVYNRCLGKGMKGSFAWRLFK